MKIVLLCVVVSIITSIITLKFFAYKYFEVIDKHVNGLISETKDAFDDAIDMMQNTGDGNSYARCNSDNAVSAVCHALPSESH